MTNQDDDQFDGFEEEEPVPPNTPASSGSNRNFLVAIGILGGIFLLAVIALVVVFAVIQPARNAARAVQVAGINAQNTATAQAATAQAEQAMLALTPSATPLPTETPLVVVTNTPVIALPTETAAPTETPAAGAGAGTDTGTGTPEAMMAAGALDGTARTQTVAAFLTQAASGETATPAPGEITPTATALPTTGFADEVGLPGLFGLSLVLLVVIFAARRLRASTSQ